MRTRELQFRLNYHELPAFRQTISKFKPDIVMLSANRTRNSALRSVHPHTSTNAVTSRAKTIAHLQQ